MRTVIEVAGADRESFLDGLITNTLPTPGEGLRYAALLTPQGKFIADFLVLAQADRLLLDVAASHAPTLFQRLSMYRLRADVTLAESELKVARGTGVAPPDSHPDPRFQDGMAGGMAGGMARVWQVFGAEAADFDDRALRVAHVVPATGIELTPDSYILEHGFERLGGVDFRKGCFVGQEVVARMKHKTELRKGLARVRLSGPVETGTEVTAQGRAAGTIHTVAGDLALAYLRFDRAEGMEAAGVEVTLDHRP
ncbi:MAG: CAF17-like 4Fe-4S cluster assembly/insertion protein YgfZ [Paracoccaceae bacterium]